MSGPILLTGVTGQVGGELAQVLKSYGEVIAPTRSEMNLADVTSVRKTIQSIRPRWIVNPAAYTAVDKAESEPELAYAINAEAVGAIGEEAYRIAAGVIHFSTDYVFAGTGSAPFREEDETGPVSVYGASKLAGEGALQRSGAACLIFRTSWVYGATGKNFLKTILKAARERERLRVVADQNGAPTWSRDLARMTSEVIRQIESSARPGELAEALASRQGIYHAAGAGETTWHGFAVEAINRLRERHPEARLAEVDAITTAEYPTPARRPLNSRLSCDRLAKTFGWKMIDWHDSLREVMAEL
ncbi:dTDP-4-dehydrorhamnose reductase [Edaphobacter sp. HDX4]|uniref:dTDP-4-dehydrorhamnose reductase n=1 Tax=Edaphobacter sp. HDX4 TaxID=2794064 RepID=UPI002FE69B46